MKHTLSLILLLAFSCGVKAQCQLITSQQTISYGSLSAMERQSAGGKAITLPEKQLTLNVMCDKPQRIRLFFGSSLPQGGNFALGEKGEMKFTAMKARVDDRDVLLAPVTSAHGELTAAEASQVDINLNDGIAFVSGDELTGKTMSVTLAVNANIKSAPISDRVKYRGNLQVRVEAQ